MALLLANFWLNRAYMLVAQMVSLPTICLIRTYMPTYAY